jgi:HEPN domain-containing protein
VEPETIDVERIKAYWLAEAEEALEVADHLLEKGDYSYALFFGHLAIEKVLKAVYVGRLHEHAPPIHNLLRLARVAGLEVDNTRTEALIAITAFNIEGRYPDFKRTFRRMCTSQYATHHITTIKEIFQWVRSQMG